MFIFSDIIILSLLDVNHSMGSILEFSCTFISWVVTWEPLEVSELFPDSYSTFGLGTSSPTLREGILPSDV